MADLKKKKRSFRLTINEELCKGCKLCIEFCPKDVLELSEEYNKRGAPYSRVIDINKCIGCQTCTLVCPEACIALYEEEQS